ncbi:MAG TPA: S41 family peptidase [Tepidisphaeraceae bacterium]|jgi:carboxyl-terminal processing protease|nr:S41 family peptidase [Tepidisphaeraceae bacterium]
MNREKFAWLLSTVLIALLAFQIPGAGGHRDDDYSFVRTLIDIHRQIDANYVEPVDNQKLQEAAIDGMLGQLDPFTNYVPPANQEQFDDMLEGSFRGVGIQLDVQPDGKVEVVTPIDNSPAARAGVQAGDIIEKVNGDPIANLKLADVIKKVKGPLGTPVMLTVRHVNGNAEDLTMNREDIIVRTIKGYRRRADAKPADADPWDYWVSKDPRIGYVRITQFTADTFDSLKKVMTKLIAEHMQGLILDVRFDPGGRLDQAKEVVNLFVSNGVIVSVKGRSRPQEITRAKPGEALPDFPMVVLANEHSASASEIVAGSLKDNKRALIVGVRTYGKGSVQELIPLEGKNGELKLTVAYYYLPSGRLVHKKKDSTDWGVDPQLAVPMDPEQEKKLILEQSASDVMHSSATHPSTQPAFVDPQLNAGLDALIQDIRSGKNTDVPAVPAGEPTTKPVIRS